MTSDLDEVKHQAAVANRMLGELGFATGLLASLGHASIRIPSQPDRFVIKGRGYRIDALSVVRPEDMIVCDLEAFLIEGPPKISQPEEVKLHSCIYRARPDVQAVVHVHPRFSVVMSILGATLVPMCNEGTLLVRNPLPVFPHSRLIISDEEGSEVARLLGAGKGILLRGHGAATAGASIEDAVITMLQLEEQAKMNWYAYCAAGPDHPKIPDEDVQEWLDGYARRFELPHLKGPLAERGAAEAVPGQVSGAWAYYSDRVMTQMASEAP